MKYLNTFIKAKNLDKRMVLDYLQGQDPRKVYPLYHAPLVPTFAGSLDIFNSSSWRRSRWRLSRVKMDFMWRLCSSMTEVEILVVQVHFYIHTKEENHV